MRAATAPNHRLRIDPLAKVGLEAGSQFQRCGSQPKASGIPKPRRFKAGVRSKIKTQSTSAWMKNDGVSAEDRQEDCRERKHPGGGFGEAGVNGTACHVRN